MSKYPECDKLRAARDKSQAIGEFIEWLQREKHARLLVRHGPEVDEAGNPVFRDLHGEIVTDWIPSEAVPDQHGNDFKEARRREREEIIQRMLAPNPNGDHDIPLRESTEHLLAEFFEIDQGKLEDERRQMLEGCRKAQETA